MITDKHKEYADRATQAGVDIDVQVLIQLLSMATGKDPFEIQSMYMDAKHVSKLGIARLVTGVAIYERLEGSATPNADQYLEEKND